MPPVASSVKVWEYDNKYWLNVTPDAGFRQVLFLLFGGIRRPFVSAVLMSSRKENPRIRSDCRRLVKGNSPDLPARALLLFLNPPIRQTIGCGTERNVSARHMKRVWGRKTVWPSKSLKQVGTTRLSKTPRTVSARSGPGYLFVGARKNRWPACCSSVLFAAFFYSSDRRARRRISGRNRNPAF